MKTQQPSKHISNQGKRVLVTGSSRGIGAAIAKSLASSGHQVTLHCRSHLNQAEQVAAEISDTLDIPPPSVLQFDVSDRKQCEQVLNNELSEHGAFYGVVCNAGVTRDKPFPALTGEDWDDVVHTNLDSFYNVLHPLVMPMVQEKYKGRIITLSSISGLIGNRGQVNYSASKAGIIGATKALSKELAKRGITVNCVAPGIIETDMTADLPKAEVVKVVPMRRLGTTTEVASLVNYLFSEEAGYLTGQVISVNGGMF